MVVSFDSDYKEKNGRFSVREACNFFVYTLEIYGYNGV